jgi:hypothetical protein
LLLKVFDISYAYKMQKFLSSKRVDGHIAPHETGNLLIPKVNQVAPVQTGQWWWGQQKLAQL